MNRHCKKCNHIVERYMNDYFCKCSIVDWIDSILHGFPEFWPLDPGAEKLGIAIL